MVVPPGSSLPLTVTLDLDGHSQGKMFGLCTIGVVTVLSSQHLRTSEMPVSSETTHRPRLRSLVIGSSLPRWVRSLHPVSVSLPPFGLVGIVDLSTMSVCNVYKDPTKLLDLFRFPLGKKKRDFPHFLWTCNLGRRA